ncbi:MAG TPA: hypothetical protein VFU21_11470 [Kofleriaceae bacterium]|nr:hypothetical protein [Kofleriaceae bacterium]
MAAAEGIPALGLGDLKRIVSDPEELGKGVVVYDRGALAHLARHGGKLYGEAVGSGGSPYRVSIAFDDRGQAKGRCTCIAARTRPFCKHAAGLLVAWSQAPASFAVSEGPPPGAEEDGGIKRRAVKTGKTDPSALMRSGIERVETMVRDLAATGVASITGARVDEMRQVSGGLRESGLRRLSARMLELASAIEPATRRAAIDAGRFAEVMCDALLTVRKLEKHLGGGEPLEARYVEELIGKTWRKADREPAAGLDLVEYGFAVRRTPDDYIIRESRFFDLVGGGHYSEKQILPAMIARRTSPKPSHAGQVLRGVTASAYPGFAPRRLDLERCDPEPLTAAGVEAMVARALPDVGAALGAFQEHRRDVFAPDRLPVAVRVDTVLATGARARWLDGGGSALFVPRGDDLEAGLAATLRGRRLLAVLGDVDLDEALPTLWPLAVVVAGEFGLELAPLRDHARDGGGGGAPPVAAARAVGASSAALSLAEVRGEMADALVAGLAMATPRIIDPLAARLRELGLDKPAALLGGLPARPDAEARFDDFVKVYQVLGLALLRLAGAAQVDRATLVPVPEFESVAVLRRDERPPPREIARRVAAGELGRWDAAVLYAGWYEAVPPDELAASIYPTWADGAAGPYVARAFAARGEQAIAAAERALASAHGRVAWMTAVRVLGAAGGARAEALLEAVARRDDVGLRALACETLESLLVARGALARQVALERRQREAQAVASMAGAILDAPRWELRVGQIERLMTLGGSRLAFPTLRTAFAADPASAVREAAAVALAQLGDTDIVEPLVALLARRHQPAGDAGARLAARALGLLGDVRGLDELLAAYAEAWKPGIVAEALRGFGPAALEPILDLLESRPELARRKAALAAIHEMPPDLLAASVRARLERSPEARKLYRKLLGKKSPSDIV